MASTSKTSRYEVTYQDGQKRIKLLTKDDADKLGEAKTVKSVKQEKS